MKNQEKLWDKVYEKEKNKWKKETILPKLLKNKIVLEIGVGNGKTLKSIIKQKPSKIYAMDFSKKAVEISKSNFVQDNLVIQKANVKKMPYENNKFDVIICHYILNNLKDKERIKAVKEIKRVIKPSGLILFEDFEKEDYRNNKEKDLYCHFFTKDEIKSLFSEFHIKEMNVKQSYPIRSQKTLKRSVINTIFICSKFENIQKIFPIKKYNQIFFILTLPTVF